MTKHTPGPWTVVAPNDDDGFHPQYRWVIRAPGTTEYVTSFQLASLSSINRDEDQADARLIAAAPDLYEALEILVEAANVSDDVRYGTLTTSFVRDIALAAIAKATGEQP